MTCRIFLLAILLDLLFIGIGQPVPISKKKLSADNSHPLRFGNGTMSLSLSLAGQNSKENHRVGFVSLDIDRNPVVTESKFEMGAYKYKSSSMRATAITAGAESGIGGMGRLSVAEADLSLGKVGITGGLNVDTGVIVKDGAFELKVFGIGTKIGKNGLQVCFWLCLGVRF